MAGRQTLDPPSAKFPNGHLYSNATQESQGIPFSGSDRGSGSDMDLSSDSDEHVYDGEYSFISSPQDDKVPNGVTAIHAASLKKSEAQCHGGTQLKLANGAGRTAQVYGGKLETGEEQFSYSACSAEVSFMQYRSNNDVPSHGELYNSDSYSSTVTSRVLHTGRTQKMEPSHSDTIILDNNRDEILNQSVRAGEHGGANESIDSLPTRCPIFHASGLGPWVAVLSYDACVRLCLNSWAKGCTGEAPYFMNEECSELRKAFGLQHVLLQPEEELLAKRSSQLVSE